MSSVIHPFIRLPVYGTDIHTVATMLGAGARGWVESAWLNVQKVHGRQIIVWEYTDSRRSYEGGEQATVIQNKKGISRLGWSEKTRLSHFEAENPNLRRNQLWGRWETSNVQAPEMACCKAVRGLFGNRRRPVCWLLERGARVVSWVLPCRTWCLWRWGPIVF